MASHGSSFQKVFMGAAGSGGGQTLDITGASITAVKDVTSDGIFNPSGLFIKPDGSKFYVLDDHVGNDIHEYNLSTNYIISSASLSQKKSLLYSNAQWGQLGAPADFYIRSDGVKLFLLDKAGYRVSAWTFGTAWDVSTLSLDSGGLAVVPNTGATNNTALGLHFKDDGTALYVSYEKGDYVRQFSLSTAWTVSSTVSADGTFDISSQAGECSSLRFNADGTQFFLLNDNERVYGYDLSTAWDISSASYAQVSPSGVFNSSENSGQGLVFDPDGLYMYFIGETDEKIEQATL